ncbi:MAG: STAS domain-containing protein [Burkholderiales bacterium]|nr:STAS domain-containing protein [Burkholderiales bacterium]GIK88289.1 MAG: anti-sigma factor antagonist [Betaproteobacteria bacterium]
MLTIEEGVEGTVVLKGRLDAAQAPLAQAHLDGVHGTATLDLAGLDYISSAGLGVLLKTQKRLMAGGGRLRLAGVNPHVRDILVYSGFDQLFEIEPAP